MIEILFGESEAGSMKFARSMQKRGSADQVVELSFDLDVGDISGELCGEARKAQCLKKYSAARWRDCDTIEQQKEKWNSLLEQVEQFKTYAAKGEAMRIWYSTAPYSMCGFYQVCLMLTEYDCPVSVVKMPEYVVRSDQNMVIYQSWGEVVHTDMLDFAKDEKPLGKMEVGYYADLWKELVKENAPLRAVVNGRLISVPADFYDFMVEGGIRERPFRAVELVSYAFRYQMGVSDDLFLESVQRLIDDGRLVVVDDEDIEWDGERLLRRAETMVSCCGLDCLECEAYGKTCQGCDKTKGKPFWLESTGDETCRVYRCCVERKSFSHCGKCMLHKYIKMEHPEEPFMASCDRYARSGPQMSEEEKEQRLEKQLMRLKKLLHQ